MQRHHTVIFVRNEGSQLRKWRLATWQIVTGGALLLALTLGASFSIWYSLTSRVDRSELGAPPRRERQAPAHQRVLRGPSPEPARPDRRVRGPDPQAGHRRRAREPRRRLRRGRRRRRRRRGRFRARRPRKPRGQPHLRARPGRDPPRRQPEAHLLHPGDRAGARHRDQRLRLPPRPDRPASAPTTRASTSRRPPASRSRSAATGVVVKTEEYGGLGRAVSSRTATASRPSTAISRASSPPRPEGRTGRRRRTGRQHRPRHRLSPALRSPDRGQVGQPAPAYMLDAGRGTS